MRRRILVAMLTVTGLAIVLFGIPLALVIERFADQNATLRLERQATIAARLVRSDQLAAGGPLQLPVGAGAAFGLYDADGQLVAGRGPATADAITSAALRDEIRAGETSRSFIVAVPVYAGQVIVGAIRAEKTNAATERRTVEVAGLLAGLAFGVFVIGGGVGALLARRLARPVHRLTRAAVDIGEGDFTVQVPPSGVAELDRAGAALTSTARRVESLLAREKAFTADASHQLRTPLAGLRAVIETELAFPRPDRTVVLNEALEDIERLETTIEDLLAIARGPRAHDGLIDVATVLQASAEAWHGRLAAAGRPLRLGPTTDLPPAAGNVALLRNALDVLLDNALVHGGGEVHIDAHVRPTTVAITVSDEGPGFGEPGADHQGEPHGMGLALANRLVDTMSGRLVIAHSGSAPRIDIVLQRPAVDGNVETALGPMDRGASGRSGAP